MSTSEPVGDGGGGRSIIHDLGYRPYDGPRLGTGAMARGLAVTGFRNAFGLGRSARSKVLPLLLLGLNLLPAVILVGVTVLFGLPELPLGYAEYASTTQVLLSIFVASQAPVLFSRDLRHGTIALYLARPLGPAAYALARWVSLLGATLVFLLVPVALMLAGALLGEMDAGGHTADAGRATALALLLAAALAGVSGLVASLSVRRGFAVVATIVVLLIGDGVVAAVQAIAAEEDRPRIGEVAGLFSPYSLYRGLAHAFGDGPAPPTPITGTGLEVAYLLVLAGLGVLSVGALVWRYRRVATG